MRYRLAILILLTALLIQALVINGYVFAASFVQQSVHASLKARAPHAVGESAGASSTSVYIIRAEERFKTHQYEETIDDLTIAIRLGSKDSYPYWRRAQAYEHLPRYQEAIADCTESNFY